MQNLKRALTINGVFSLFTGFSLLISPIGIANFLETSLTIPFLLLGIGLTAFAIFVLITAAQLPEWLPAAFFIIILDTSWVLASGIFRISAEGYWLIAGIGLIVAGFATHQTYALYHQDHSKNKQGNKHLQIRQSMPGDQQKVWQVIADVSNYHLVAPNIDDVKVISGEGWGMVRQCFHGNESWTETCTYWEPEKGYAFEVDTTPQDYPYPFQYLKGKWTIENTPSKHVEVVLDFEFRYKKAIHHIIVHPFLRSWFTKVCKQLLTNWQEQIKKR